MSFPSNAAEMSMEPDSWLSSPGTVPAVDPSDLKKVWNLLAEEERTHSRRATGIEVFEETCSPGADAVAVWYRATMLGLLCKTHAGVSRHLHDGKPDERLLTVAASFPMEKMQPDVLLQTVPFDIAEFLKRIEADPGKQP
jgi:hypothetical protein